MIDQSHIIICLVSSLIGDKGSAVALARERRKKREHDSDDDDNDKKSKSLAPPTSQSNKHLRQASGGVSVPPTLSSVVSPGPLCHPFHHSLSECH